jgi:alpha-beta hydrolase superfamily lysophospholipase
MGCVKRFDAHWPTVQKGGKDKWTAPPTKDYNKPSKQIKPEPNKSTESITMTDRAPHEEKWKTQHGLRLTRMCWGDTTGSDTVVLIHHGLGDHAGRYSELAASFQRPGVSVWAYDMRGHGTSDGARGDAANIDMLVDDLSELIDDLVCQTGCKHLFVYGHSVGGLVVARYATRQMHAAVRGVILSAPCFRAVRTLSVRAKIATGRMLNRLLPKLTLANPADPVGISTVPEEQQRYANDPLIHDRLTLRLGTSLVDDGEATVALGERVTTPVLAFHGDADGVIDIDATRAFVDAVASSDKKFWPISACRHEPHHDTAVAKEKLFRDLSAWLEERMV